MSGLARGGVWVLMCVVVCVADGQEATVAGAGGVEAARHQGVWRALSFEREGQQTAQEIVRSITREVKGDRVVWKREGKSFAATGLRLDAGVEPHTIDVIPEGGPGRGKAVLGIYRLEGGRLTLCMADPDGARPDAFSSPPKSGRTLMTFEREEAGVP